MNTVTLAQAVKGGLEFASLSYPTLITTINAKLSEANIKANPLDERPIQIRSVHRHPSNDLVLYTTTALQAEALRTQGDDWLSSLSSNLSINNPVHTVVVHGIPTSFNPADPQHLDMIVAMNPDTLNPAPAFIKWISPNAVQRGATHSSIRIGFADAAQAKLTVEQKIFYGRFNKRTEFGRRAKPRCMNCLQEGHITRYCKEELMCPYCAGPHAADKCEWHGKMKTNCTACARHMQKANPTADIKAIFSETPRHLRHSPLDPTCPARIAEKQALAAKATPTDPPTSANPAITRPIVVPDDEPVTAPSKVGTAPRAEDTSMNTSC